MSFFIRLLETTDVSRREFESLPRVTSMLSDGLNAAEYRALLQDLYHIVWHFCPTMAAAAARCDDRFEIVRYELYDRIGEEKGHEKWVLGDLEAVGGSTDLSRLRAASSAAQCLIAFNYYCAERGHPCSVLGMLYCLEVVASAYAATIVQSVARSLQKNEQGPGFRFLLSHSAMDQLHVAKLNSLFKAIEDSDAQEAIVNATRVNFAQLGRVFAEDGFLSHIGN